ncbi:MAG: ParB/RepB/Spo0J family partition protein [Clostridia bacterium]|nr:ParB/RepB/Spo0J family partition protein [Clostridia bacterium]
MATKAKGGLGRGLDSIFLDNTAPENGAGTSMVRISQIEPRRDQPRKNFDLEALQQLADSISTHGIIQPVAVRESIGGYYEIIAGERRWRAAKMAGLSEIPVTVIAADDKKAAELALIENVQREDLNPIEEALAYKKLSEEYGLTQEKVAQAVGKSRSGVANSLRLLDLPEECLEMVASRILSEGHAKVLMGIEDEEELVKAAHTVVQKELSVRETEALVKRINAALFEEDEEEAPVTPVKVNYSKVLAEKAGRHLGRRVNIAGRGKSKRIELYYEDREDLEAILESLCGKQLFEDEI